MLASVLRQLHRPDIRVVLHKASERPYRSPLVRAAVIDKDKFQVPCFHLPELLHRILDDFPDRKG